MLEIIVQHQELSLKMMDTENLKNLQELELQIAKELGFEEDNFKYFQHKYEGKILHFIHIGIETKKELIKKLLIKREVLSDD